MDKQKEIRFVFPQPEDYTDYEEAKKLFTIRGLKEGAGVIDLIRRELRKKEVRETLDRTWVDQPTLIAELEKRKGIKTNPQTLYNYRARGEMDGLFGADGGKGLLYDLDACLIYFESLDTTPRSQSAV